MHRVKDFSALLPEKRLGVHKKLGGDTARIADLNELKEYSMTYDITASDRARGEDGGGNVWSDGICFPKKQLCMMSPTFL